MDIKQTCQKVKEKIKPLTDKVSVITEKLRPHRNLILTITTAFKYFFPLLICIQAFSIKKNPVWFIATLIELGVIFLLLNCLQSVNKIVAYLINLGLFFMFTASMLVLRFAGSYTTVVMITNMDSVEDLSGHAATYIAYIVIMCIAFLLPMRYVNLRFWSGTRGLAVGLGVYLCFMAVNGSQYSPIYSVYSLCVDHQKYNKMISTIEKASEQKQVTRVTQTPTVTPTVTPAPTSVPEEEKETVTPTPTPKPKKQVILNEEADIFYKEEIKGYYDKPVALTEKPNVILILTEGLSQCVVDDERNLMPNLRKLEETSLNFSNYYNHTFATYRGIIGQLYSGYQLDNYDRNDLISMQSIFSDQGYQTAFINTEPINEEFSDYLKAMDFDQLVTDTENLEPKLADTLSDKEAYRLLIETAEEMNQGGSPFFLGIYTFNTHMSLDSTTGIKYGDGKLAELNKFVNLDSQLGRFLDEFKKSDLVDNTIIVFTADHCTYDEQYFTEAFPDVVRVHSDVQDIPLLIYHKGVESKTIDVKGRNSLDLAPTVMDYLDISAPNYYLGTSLFSPKDNGNEYDTIFYDMTFPQSTENGEILPLSDEAYYSFEEKVTQYFVAKIGLEAS